MKSMRCAMRSLAAGALVCWVSWGGWAQQSELPQQVQQWLKEGQNMGSTAPSTNLMVTNAEFKKFKPSWTFAAKEADFPALMTEREALDYATFVGKKLGVDYIWQVAPVPQGEPAKAAGKGYVVVQSATLAATGKPVPPPTPPPGMAYVPEGPFLMGSDAGDPDEAPKHLATAGPYFVDKLEVSNAEFKAMFPDFSFQAGMENYAAVVTWEQAAAYAAKVEKRLPTEAEWEKAARGTDGRTFPWGETYDPTCVAWDEKCPRGGAPARPESPYGCLDMAGGVWEWTADWYQPYPGNESPSDEYGETYKVIRGGGSFNDVAMMRTTQRYYLPPKTTGNVRTGFRCVKDLGK